MYSFPLRALPEKDSTPSLLNPIRKYCQPKLLRPFRPELQSLVDKLESEGQAKEIAVYFRAFNDGVWIGIKEKIPFAPASLIKVPLMMVYLKKAETDPSLLEKKLTVESLGIYDQLFPSQIKLEARKSYPVDWLLKVMIQDSNNNAMRVLSLNADAELGEAMYRQLGYTTTFMDQGDFLPLKVYAGTFRILYNATYLNEAMSEKALGYLTQTRFDQGIVAGVPPGTTVAHKFGEYLVAKKNLKQLHDVGIIYYPGCAYLLGIMTRGDDFEKMAQVIAQISSFVYREVDGQYKASSATPDFDLKFLDEG